MSRYIGPKCKLCRREGVKLFLKGARCDSPKCALFRKQQAPGQHGTPRRRPSEYAIQLREKQKVKRLYGVAESQFRRYLKEALALRGKAGEHLLKLLERRLDNVVFRAGFGVSRAQARQLIGHGKVLVNDQLVNRPSFLVSQGDKIAFAEGVTAASDQIVPGWLKVRKSDPLEVQVRRLPERDELGFDLDESLVVEFYSR